MQIIIARLYGICLCLLFFFYYCCYYELRLSMDVTDNKISYSMLYKLIIHIEPGLLQNICIIIHSLDKFT